MKKYKQALIIGRFQPLCKNHIALFEKAKEISENLLIAVGRPNYTRAKQVLDKRQFLEYQIKNLFSYERTKQFIDEALKDAAHYVIPVQDIFNQENYASHVTRQFKKQGILTDDCVLIGENQATYKCFTDAGIDILVAEKICDYHATDVRKDIAIKGSSDRLASILEKYEIKRIQDAHHLLNALGDETYKMMRILGYNVIN